MVDQVQSVIESITGLRVMFMPGCKRRNDYAVVSRVHRRVCSRVSRTSLAVSLGSSISGIATTPAPRFRKVIGVAATSISSRPSPARISRDWPGFKLSAWRSDLGTTMRPAESMVVFIPLKWHKNAIRTNNASETRTLTTPNSLTGSGLRQLAVGCRSAYGAPLSNASDATSKGATTLAAFECQSRSGAPRGKCMR